MSLLFNGDFDLLCASAFAGAFGKALKLLADSLIGAPCKRLLSACFARGTLLRTEGGLQAIQTLRPNERVLSRDEHDVRGELAYKVVEEVFERLGWMQGSRTTNR